MENRFNLKSFIEKRAAEFFEANKSSSSNRSVNDIINYYFEDFDLKFDISNESDPYTIAEVLWTYVVEFYGSDCWKNAEQSIKTIPPDAEELDLAGCIETLDYWCHTRYVG